MGAVLRPIALAPLIALASAVGASAQAGVPLCPGLTIVGVVSEPEGDYEPIVTVEAVDAAGVHLRYTAEVRQRSGAIRKIEVRRLVRSADLENASLTMPWFNTRAAITIPGTTAIGPSRSVLRALRKTGTATLGLFDAASSAYPATREASPSLYDYQMDYRLQRAGNGPVLLPVIVNGVPTELPVIHATGEHMGDRADFYFLDDDANPLSLSTRQISVAGPEAATIARVVKISFRCPPGPAAVGATDRLERSLADSGRADVYDIHFDFNSDRIREASEPTLRELAELLGRHPDWRLAVTGHTDDIASDRFNLELSARRAAAVKAALVERFGIAGSRLTTAGAGEGSPKNRNDTPEGRARNRRVELVRAP